MTTHAQLRFEDASEPIADLRVHRLDYADTLNQPFSLTLGILSSDSAIEPKQVLGKLIGVLLVGEPWLTHLRGIVVGFSQRTAFGGPDGASMYEVAIRPPLWLLAKRFARRIHQEATAVEALAATLAPAATGKVGRPLERPEYAAQSTVRSVCLFQREVGLVVDGQAGPLTQGKLVEVHGC